MENELIETNEIANLESRAFQDSFTKTRKPLGILLSLYKGNYRYLFLSVFFYLIQILPTLVSPIVLANVINIATNREEHTITELVLNLVIWGTLILLNIPFTYLSTRFRSVANRRVEAGLRATIARKLQQLSIAFYKEMASGRMQSKIIRDVENIEGLSNSIFSTCLSIAVSVTTAIVVTLSKSLIVFAFFLITIPSAVVLIRLFRNKMAKQNSAYRSDMENANASVNEMVELLLVTKAHAVEATALSKFNKRLFHVANSGYKLDCTHALFGSTSWVVFQIFSLMCLGFSGFLAYRQMIEIGDIALYQSYFSSVVGSISSVIALLPAIAKGFDSIRSIGDIMWAMDEEESDDKTKLTEVKGSFSFRHVGFSYPNEEHPILKDFNLEIKAGETIALVGESGSGKSTALNMIIGFYRPTQGSIFLDGVDMKNIDLHSYRSHLATVPQNSVLFSGSIRDNITYGLENYSEEDVRRAIRAANLEEVIASLPNGLDTNVGEHGDKLSGGQKQRIAIARAVIRNASIIIFDEATSALDSVSEKMIQDAIDKLAQGRTTFIVAHRLSTIRNADKIAVIKDGRCAEFGTYEELMEKKGEFYKFKSLQS